MTIRLRPPMPPPTDLGQPESIFAVVYAADLKALEEAKDRYEKFYLDHAHNTITFTARAQQASGPVAQQSTKQLPCPRPGDRNDDVVRSTETLHEHEVRSTETLHEHEVRSTENDDLLTRARALINAERTLTREIDHLLKIYQDRLASLGASR